MNESIAYYQGKPEHLAKWERVRERLRNAYGEAIFKSWLQPLKLADVKNGQVMVTVPTRFMREWILSHYADNILRFWCQEDQTIHSVDIFVKAEPVMVNPVQNAPSNINIEAAMLNAANEDKPLNPDTISAPLDPRYTFDNFVVGKPNELAHAAARRVSESSSVTQGGNPLFLYGGVGLGKTHLMHAIAWHIRRTDPARKVVYLSAEKFMYLFIRALRTKETMTFKEYFRSVDVLMVDDVQFIAGKESTQEEFFHTFNALIDQNKQLIISADRSPNELEGMEERIRSRLGWGLVADIHTTTYELRLGILQSKVEKMPHVHVPARVLEFLAHKITSNVRELEGALNRVVAHTTLVGTPITLESTQEVLYDILRANDRRITIEDIQKKVAAHYNIKISDMHSARRSVAIARPRQVAMYLAKKLTTKSLPEIGRKFGGKDHTTVMHAVKRIDEICKADQEFADDVELLMRMLQSAT
ncbi:MAG: chromosomal replication initiator protein DnaA [Alphaproteobacteria bacterium]|nr:chromosomal replication initiator protein DnaA [Alphaproteobacteria bacterium]